MQHGARATTPLRRPRLHSRSRLELARGSQDAHVGRALRPTRVCIKTAARQFSAFCIWETKREIHENEPGKLWAQKNPRCFHLHASV